MSAIYQRRRDLVVGALREIGDRDRARRKGTIYVWAPVPDGPHLGVVLRAGAGGGRRRGLPRAASYGPNGEGFFRISLTVPDERLAEAVERMRGSLA